VDLATIRDALASDLFDGLPSTINVYAREQQTMQAPYVLITTPTDGNHVDYYQSWSYGVQIVRYTLELRAGGRYEDAIRTLDDLMSFGADQPMSVSQALRNPTALTELGVTVIVRNTTGAEADDNGAGALMPIELYPPKEA
jgi:hypothetical protein